MYTKQHYQHIALMLFDEQPCPSWLNKHVQWRLICQRFAKELKNDNPKFKTDLFLYACKTGKTTARKVPESYANTHEPGFLTASEAL